MNQKINSHIDIKAIEYHANLATTLFASIEHLPFSMLLRSAAPGHVNNRYDILVSQPTVTLDCRGPQSQICIMDPNGNVAQQLSSEQDPFTLLDHYLNLYLPSCTPLPNLPFVGGALGYFSYDLGRRIESMASLAQQDIQASDMLIGLYDWALVVDHQLHRACVVGINVEARWQWLLAQQPTKLHKDFQLTSDWQSNMDKASYSDKFNRIQDYLLSGDCYQINLAQRFSAYYQGSEWQAYQKLEQQNHAPFSAFIRAHDSAILSISPERFLQLYPELNPNNGEIQRIVETKPIKGTRPRSQDSKQDQQLANELAEAEKDQAENLMIVDLLRNDIGRVATPGSVHVPELFAIESFPAVHHLVSTIRATLDAQYSATDLLRACFPGGSITGAPKVRAMQIIEELEPHRRSAYCGSIGYISRCGHMDTNIAIRSLVAQQGQLHVWAGGGIVADSQVDAEYQETHDKVSRIVPVLQSKSLHSGT